MLRNNALAAGGRLNLADIGVGDPGDWSKFTKPTGWGVNVVATGNAPSAILNVLIAGSGTTTYDLINIVGGMQKPLLENGLVEPIDPSLIWLDRASLALGGSISSPMCTQRHSPDCGSPGRSCTVSNDAAGSELNKKAPRQGIVCRGALSPGLAV